MWHNLWASGWGKNSTAVHIHTVLSCTVLSDVDQILISQWHLKWKTESCFTDKWSRFLSVELYNQRLVDDVMHTLEAVIYNFMHFIKIKKSFYVWADGVISRNRMHFKFVLLVCAETCMCGEGCTSSVTCKCTRKCSCKWTTGSSSIVIQVKP